MKLSHSSTPSFFRKIAFTAAGLALPPVAFITWPTNQPKRLRLGLHLLHLLGVGGDDLIDDLLDGAGVGDLLEAAALDDLGRAPLRSRP